MQRVTTTPPTNGENRLAVIDSLHVLFVFIIIDNPIQLKQDRLSKSRCDIIPRKSTDGFMFF
jgi:hypothetical protein